MPDTTDGRLEVPYSAGTDAAHTIDNSNQEMAEFIRDNLVAFSHGSYGARPESTPENPGKTGRFYYVSSGGTNQGRLYYDYGTGWIDLSVPIGNGAFSVYRNSALSLADGGQITWDTEVFDVSGWFASSVFTPQINGLYLLSAFSSPAAPLSADKFWSTILRKNGSSYARLGVGFQRGSNLFAQVGGSVLVAANGSTDYFDVAVSHDTGASTALSIGSPVDCRFEGHLLGRQS